VTDSEIDAADRTTLSEHGVDVVIAQGAS